MTARGFLGSRLIMAPMSRGTDLPFRRLAGEWGATVCLGEMAYSHKVVRGARTETALLRRHPDERCFGAQIAGKDPAMVAEAASIAAEMGADFVDLNLGCPIDDATRRGYGASLLRRGTRVTALVRAMKDAISIPVTVKLRLGWSSEKPTYLKIARAAAEGGVDAITLHARSRNQRYRRPAEWDHVRELVEAVPVPIIGNGDILTWRDARKRLDETGCAAVMVGRWALAKPWIFREFTEQREIRPGTDERVAMLRRYVELCLEHFGDDEMGRERTRRFVVFHQDFFRRYRPGAGLEAVNSDDPRDWGESPSSPLEEWLCRADLEAVEALCRWLVDNEASTPPPPAARDSRRAVKLPAWG